MLLCPRKGQAEGMWRSDKAFEGRQRGKDSHPARPRLLLPLHSHMYWGLTARASCCPRCLQPCNSSAPSTSPCRYRPPHAACTAYTPHSSTNALGTGTAVSPPGSVCCGHAHSRCSRSSSHGDTCGQRCPGRSGQQGRSWASRPGARAPACGAEGHHPCPWPGPLAVRWRQPRRQPHWWCCPP